MTNTGTIISDARRSKGLTQKDIADALGVSVQSVSQWETGRSAPQGSRVLMLGAILGVSPAVLLGEKTFREAPPAPKMPSPIPVFQLSKSLFYVGYVDPDKNNVEPIGMVVPSFDLQANGFGLIVENDGYPTKDFKKGDLIIFEKKRKDVRIGDIVYELIVTDSQSVDQGQVLVPDGYIQTAIQARIRPAPTSVRSYMDDDGKLVSVSAVMVEHRRLRTESDPEAESAEIS